MSDDRWCVALKGHVERWDDVIQEWIHVKEAPEDVIDKHWIRWDKHVIVAICWGNYCG